MVLDREREERRRWGIDRRVSVTDITTILCAFVAIIYSYNTLDKRIALVEQAQVQSDKELQAAMIQLQRENLVQDRDRVAIRELITQGRAETREDFRRVNEKLDRIVEMAVGERSARSGTGTGRRN